MGKLYSYVVTKNEAGRYLPRTLMNLARFVDGFVVYDDRSDDTKVAPLLKALLGGEYICRPEDVPSFLENESLFRQAAWQAMEDTFHPVEGDWVITLDADEELLPSSREAIDAVIDNTVALGTWLPVREIWRDDDTGLYARTDGYWDTITALRLVQYKPGGEFTNKGMGGGSVPSYVKTTILTDELVIYHYGYTTQADREARFKRYTEHPGHNPAHVRSILEPPVLVKVNA